MPIHSRTENSLLRHAFGRRLRTLRTAVGYSQEELAARANLHRTYVGSIERGERNVAIENIYALAKALDVDVRALFDPGNEG